MADPQKPLTLHPRPPTTSYNRVVQYGLVVILALVIITYLTVMSSRGERAKWEKPDRFVMVNRPLIVPEKPSPPPLPPPVLDLPVPAPQAPRELPRPTPRPQSVSKPNPDIERRREALLKALSAKVLVEDFSADRARHGATAVALNQPPQTLEIPRAWNPGPPMIGPQDALVGHNQQFWQQSSDGTTGQYLAASVQPPRSPYQVNAGTIVPAVLTHGITSDLEGTLTAVVSRDVYDSVTGRYLLIPQGARLFGVYDADLKANQPRLHLAFKTLYFPDGYSLALQGMPGMDARGFAGVTDQVNRHFLQRYGTAAVLSLITAGISMAVHGSNNFYAYEPQDAAMYGAGQVLGRAVAEDLRRGMQIRPTITVRAAYPFNLTVTQDVIFPGPYPFSQFAQEEQ